MCGEFSYLRFSRSITIINVVAYLYVCFIHDTRVCIVNLDGCTHVSRPAVDISSSAVTSELPITDTVITSEVLAD